MIQSSRIRRFALACLTAGLLLGTAVFAVKAQQKEEPATPAATSSAGNMSHMSGHMYMTTLRPLQPGDQQKADAIVAAAKTAMAPYQDYRKAL
jgi:hypothetical protein